VRKSRATRLRSTFALLALTLGGAIAACGFSGEGAFVGTGTLVAEGGTDEGAPKLDSGTADSLVPPDDGGSNVLLDGAGTIEDPPVDAGDDGGCPPNSYRCMANNTCVTACSGCVGALFRCATTATCIATCEACAGRQFECASCLSNGVTLAKRTCEPTATACYGDGTVHCSCSSLGGCYSAQQVCSYRDLFTGYDCRSCGEPDTSNETCVGAVGKKCSPGANKFCK